MDFSRDTVTHDIKIGLDEYSNLEISKIQDYDSIL